MMDISHKERWLHTSLPLKETKALEFESGTHGSNAEKSLKTNRVYPVQSS